MKESKQVKTPNKGGRPQSNDPAKHIFQFRLTDSEKLKFEKMLGESGVADRSNYIKSVIFGKRLKVVKVDKATMDYYIRLTNFYHQFQAIGNNYNQTVKALKSNFGEKRGLQMLYKLEKATIELVVLSKKIIALTKEYEAKYLQPPR